MVRYRLAMNHSFYLTHMIPARLRHCLFSILGAHRLHRFDRSFHASKLVENYPRSIPHNNIPFQRIDQRLVWTTPSSFHIKNIYTRWHYRNSRPCNHTLLPYISLADVSHTTSTYKDLPYLIEAATLIQWLTTHLLSIYTPRGNHRHTNATSQYHRPLCTPHIAFKWKSVHPSATLPKYEAPCLSTACSIVTHGVSLFLVWRPPIPLRPFIFTLPLLVFPQQGTKPQRIRPLFLFPHHHIPTI